MKTVWRPISTAPKHKPVQLCYPGTDRRPWVSVGRYVDVPHASATSAGAQQHTSGRWIVAYVVVRPAGHTPHYDVAYRAVKPTHWQPLAAPLASWPDYPTRPKALKPVVERASRERFQPRVMHDLTTEGQRAAEDQLLYRVHAGPLRPQCRGLAGIAMRFSRHDYVTGAGVDRDYAAACGLSRRHLARLTHLGTDTFELTTCASWRLTDDRIYRTAHGVRVRVLAWDTDYMQNEVCAYVAKVRDGTKFYVVQRELQPER